MNSDRIKGKANQMVGKMKQGAGEMTGNEQLANKGVADQVKGAAQETWGNVKDTVHEVARTQEANRQHKSAEMRDNVATRVEDARNRANDKLDEIKDRERQRRTA
jgi:uncharacterized protein YjbJ (UPF0337 family)